MTTEVVMDMLIWSLFINMGLLLWWFGWFLFGHELIYRIHTKWFLLSRERFDAIHYSGMAIYKLFIVFFNLVPLITLYLVA